MKKLVILSFVTVVALSARAQVYVGGIAALWHNNDLDATIFALDPEVGHNLNEKLVIGDMLIFVHSKLDEGKYNASALAPHARYSYYENKVIRLFIDGGLDFSAQEVKGLDSVNGFKIGFKLGIVTKLNDRFSVLAKCSSLGYGGGYMDMESGYGFGLTSKDLSISFHYELRFIPNIDMSKRCSAGAFLSYYHAISNTKHTHPEKERTRKRRFR